MFVLNIACDSSVDTSSSAPLVLVNPNTGCVAAVNLNISVLVLRISTKLLGLVPIPICSDELIVIAVALHYLKY